MSRTFVLILLFISMTIVSIAATAPLSFVMRHAGLANHGLSWQEARGTLWNGQLIGVGYGGRQIGTVEVSTQAAPLFTGKLSQSFQWNGPFGQGSGNIVARRDEAALSDVTIDVSMDNLPSLPSELAQLDARLTVADGYIASSGTNCSEAGGEAQTNLLTRLGARYGREWPEMSGTMFCDGDLLVLPFSAQTALGEEFALTISLGLDGSTAVDAIARNMDAQTQLALVQAGFVSENGAYSFSDQTPGALRLTPNESPSP